MTHRDDPSARVRPAATEGTGFDVVACAASAGGLNALSQLLSQLPSDFPASVLIVQHLDPRHRSLMAEILSRRTRLPVEQAAEGSTPEPGHVYIAPPNRHSSFRWEIEVGEMGEAQGKAGSDGKKR